MRYWRICFHWVDIHEYTEWYVWVRVVSIGVDFWIWVVTLLEEMVILGRNGKVRLYGHCDMHGHGMVWVGGNYSMWVSM